MLSSNQHTPKHLGVILKQVDLVYQEEIEIQECQRKVDIAIAQLQSEEEAKKHAKDFVLPPMDTKRF
jgi:TFIIF-interacting CTD phosphatase-like protein